MNKLILILFIFATMGAYRLPVQISELKNKESLIVKQNGAWWCWAASVESVLKYKHISISQEEIVKTVKNRQDLGLYEQTSNQMGLDYGQIEPLFSYYIGEEFKSFFKISRNSVTEAIDNGNPVIVLFNQHISVIVGYKKDYQNITYSLMDTGDHESSFRDLKYDELFSENRVRDVSFYLVSAK